MEGHKYLKLSNVKDASLVATSKFLLIEMFHCVSIPPSIQKLSPPPFEFHLRYLVNKKLLTFFDKEQWFYAKYYNCREFDSHWASNICVRLN